MKMHGPKNKTKPLLIAQICLFTASGRYSCTDHNSVIACLACIRETAVPYTVTN